MSDGLIGGEGRLRGKMVFVVQGTIVLELLLLIDQIFPSDWQFRDVDAVLPETTPALRVELLDVFPAWVAYIITIIAESWMALPVPELPSDTYMFLRRLLD